MGNTIEPVNMMQLSASAVANIPDLDVMTEVQLGNLAPHAASIISTQQINALDSESKGEALLTALGEDPVLSSRLERRLRDLARERELTEASSAEPEPTGRSENDKHNDPEGGVGGANGVSVSISMLLIFCFYHIYTEDLRVALILG